MDHSFGSWVKHRRKALDLTQKELAQRVGCSLATIVKIEADERRPSHQIADLLARHLEIPPDQRPLFLEIARQKKGITGLAALAPLPAPGAVPHIEQLKTSLPAPPTPLIGREHEVAMILRQLQDPACRLLTLVGPGGVGKTRLGLEVAHRLQAAFPDGAFFVSLVGTSTPEYILPAIAEAVGFTFSSADNPKSQLFNFLRTRGILLVLDNLEHLLDGVEYLSELLEHSSGLKILATSREQLNLRAEWAITVQGLPIPAKLGLDNAESNSAVLLFLQRARQADNGFTLSAADLPHIERICRLVEGLPLGLEIAATWVRTLSCGEIAQEIENSLDFLTASARDVPQRHRSIRAVFDYSWSLLSPEEQQVMMKLTVFQGGFTRQAAEQVAEARLPVLSALVDKSLVWHSANRRFELHELIRQYAHEQLARSGMQQETRDRHFKYFLKLIEDSRAKLRSSEQLEWLDLMENDHDNLRAALEWSLRYEHLEVASSIEQEATIQASFRFAGAMLLFWRLHNHWSEGRRWLQRVLDQPAGRKVTRERGRALNAAVMLATEQADVRRARRLAEENLAVARQLDEPHILARAYHSMGVVLWKQKEYAQAQASCEQAVALFREMGNRLAVAGSLQILGRIATNRHDLEAAHAYLSECIELFQESSNMIELNASVSDLGLLAYLRGDFATARTYLERSLKLFREAGNISGIEMSMNRLGDIARCENNYEEAERLYTESMNIYRESGDKDEIASLLHNLGYVAQHRGVLPEALGRFREALALQCGLDNQAGIAECLAGIAGVLAMEGQGEGAARLFGAAEALREAAGAVLWPANRIEFERTLACLRKSLDEDSLAEAWTLGRRMSLEEAVDEASSRL